MNKTRQSFITNVVHDYNSTYPISGVIGVRHILMGNDHRQGRCWIIEQWGGGGFPNMEESTEIHTYLNLF